MPSETTGSPNRGSFPDPLREQTHNPNSASIPDLSQEDRERSLESPESAAHEQDSKAARRRAARSERKKRSRKRKIDENAVLSTGTKRTKIEDSEASTKDSEVKPNFVGFISPTRKEQAKLVAKGIHRLPVPEQVKERLVMFSDCSINSRCGAVGIARRARADPDKWVGRGRFFPITTNATEMLEMFGVSTALWLALVELQGSDSDISKPVVTKRAKKNRLRIDPGGTQSHQHTMEKELFVFTDRVEVLEILSEGQYKGSTPFMSEIIDDVCRLSQLLHAQGVHLEIHYSPGHSGIPGNVAADRMARECREALQALATNSWPTDDVRMPLSFSWTTKRPIPSSSLSQEPI